MVRIIHRRFTVGCVALVLLVCPYVCIASLCQKDCNCSTITLSKENSELKGRCICPEYGIVPEHVLRNVVELELDYSRPVILSTGDIQKFNQIFSLNISGLQFVEPGGFQGLETLLLLVLHNNYMRVMETAMFTDLGKLTRLTIEGTTKNRIHALENGTFLGLKKLNHLCLKGNAITEITEEHFRDLESLGTLDFSNNSLTQITSHTFIHAPLLTQVHLSNNLITEIHRHAFVGLTRLERLALDGNRIKGMPRPEFLLLSFGFSSVGSNVRHVTILLENNPLHCDCHLNWISSWLDNGQECEGSCLTPIIHTSQSLEHVYKNGLPQCQPNNTVLSVEPGKKLELTCSFGGASWMTPVGQRLQEHGDCEDPFYLTNSDSLVIWKTSPDLSGNYTCLSSDGAQAFFYQVDVKESFTVKQITYIVIGTGSLIVFIIIIIFLVRRCRPHPNPNPRPNVRPDDEDANERAHLVGDRPEADPQDRAQPARGANFNAIYNSNSDNININKSND